MLRVLVTLISLQCSVLLAQSDTAITEDVNSILDDLDKRLTDQENQVLTFDEQRLFEQGKEKPSQSISFKAKTVTPGDTVDDELRRLSDAVLKLDKEIEELDGSVQSTKQKVLEDAGIDNIISIEGKIASDNAASLRSLVVKLDGYTIYELNENNGLWIPSAQIPLYRGPLPPGPHKLEVSGRVLQKLAQNTPLSPGGFQTVSLTKTIDVAAGNSRENIIVDLNPEAP